MFDVQSHSFRAQIQAWLDEDLAYGDITSMSVVPENHRSKAVIHTKQSGVIAGLRVAGQVFHTIDPSLSLEYLCEDGETAEKGRNLMVITGSTVKILSAERLALNLLQHMSGIATKTAKYVERLHGLPTRLVDTRKTLPGLRLLEKYAVRTGGGHNHRFGLFDAVMIKDNHIKAAGGVADAIASARAQIPHTMKIEVEIEQLTQLNEALAADVIMLDNMPLNLMREAVQFIRDSRREIVIEASGNVSLDTVREIAQTGVDIISAGALTHSVQALDISLDLNEQKESGR